MNNGPKTVQPSVLSKFRFVDPSRKTSKAADSVNLPKSARNNSYPISKISNLNTPFFLSETLLQNFQTLQKQNLKETKNLDQQKQIVDQKQNSQKQQYRDKLSPRFKNFIQNYFNRGNSGSSIKQIQSPSNKFQKQHQSSNQQRLSSEIQQTIAKQLSKSKQPSISSKQQSANSLIKLQKIIESQENYQKDGFQFTSVQNANLDKQFFSSAKLNSGNQFCYNKESFKNKSKINTIKTAGQQTNHEKKKYPGIIGSQTHRVTSQGNIYKQQLQKKIESNSKDNLNNLLSSNNAFLNKKVISENLIKQIQTMGLQQSSLQQKQKSLLKSTTMNQQKVMDQFRKPNKQSQFRKSLEQNSQIQHRALQNHFHAKSDMKDDVVKLI